MENKKKRGANFTASEINLFMQCLLPELKIIENKQTDGATLNEKKSAWQRVTTSFNSLNNGDNHRDLNSIKMKYENIKKTLKRKISDNKQNYTATGGGPPVDSKLLWYEEQLYSLLQLSIDGLPSVGDCDTITIENLAEVPSTDHSYISYSVTSDNNENLKLNYLGNIQQHEATENTEEIEIIVEDTPFADNVESMVNNSHNDGDNLKITNTPSRTPLNSNRWNLKKRKRNTITSDQKKSDIDKFQTLAESKTSVALIQKQCYEVELQYKKDEATKNLDILDKKLQLLNYDIKLKEEAYEEMVEERKRKKKIFELMEREYSLKFDILKCELNKKLSQNVHFSNL